MPQSLKKIFQLDLTFSEYLNFKKLSMCLNLDGQSNQFDSEKFCILG